MTTMLLAKVIPIVNGLIYTILADAPNPFVQVSFEIPVDSWDLLIHVCLYWWQNLHQIYQVADKCYWAVHRCEEIM